MPSVAITGASGFLGGHLCRAFAARGWPVRALVRRPDAAAVPPGIAVGRMALPDAIDAGELAGVEVLVHNAWATRETDPGELARVNVDGARRLFETGRAAGVRSIVFVSSIAAGADAPNAYGRMKHDVEALCDPGRDLVVRPGTILARGGGGIFGLMRDLMRRLHVVPLFGGGRQPLQTVHVDDLCEAIVRAVEQELSGTLDVAEPEPLAFRDVLRLAATRMGVRCVFVPLPFGPVLAAVQTLERAGVPVPLRSESLLGMRGLRRVPADPALGRLGVRIRPVAESIDAIF